MLSWRGETPAFRVPVPFLLPWFPWPLWHHFWFVRLCFITDAPGHLFRPPCRFMEIGSGGWDCTRTTHADGAKGIKPFVLLGSSLFLEYTESSSSIGERNELAMSSADDSYLWLWILLISMAHERACLLSQRREQTT